MANEQSIELGAYHAAIKATLSQAFPDFYVLDYERTETNLSGPSLVLELTGWNSPDDGQDSTGMLSWDFTWSLFVAIRYNADQPKLTLRQHALAACQVIEQARWGLPLAPAHVLTVEADDFDPELDAYEVFRIDFTQSGRVGVNAFADADVSDYAGTNPYASMEPDTGIPHEPDYDPLQ